MGGDQDDDDAVKEARRSNGDFVFGWIFVPYPFSTLNGKGEGKKC